MEGLPHTKRWYIQQMMEFVTEIYIYIIEYSPYLESPPCLYLCVYIYNAIHIYIYIQLEQWVFTSSHVG